MTNDSDLRILQRFDANAEAIRLSDYRKIRRALSTQGHFRSRTTDKHAVSHRLAAEPEMDEYPQTLVSRHSKKLDLTPQHEQARRRI
jgi:hypothetical protein